MEKLNGLEACLLLLRGNSLWLLTKPQVAGVYSSRHQDVPNPSGRDLLPNIQEYEKLSNSGHNSVFLNTASAFEGGKA